MYAGDAIPAANKPFLEGILTGVRHMESVVRDLLSYTQAIRHRDGSVPVVSAQSVLAGVVESLREQIADCGAEIHFDHLPDVAIHEFHLSQLFQNLIGNALKYRGSEVPRVEISAHCVDGWTVFSVSDNGIGIEPKYAEQIFVLFKRLHTRAEFPGSGIGLSICQRVVEQYGGRIWLEHSVPGQGSAFSFSVPDRRP
jgi:light-regulated signal transduction histidine kinase (bacteriophytochrome)